MSRVLDPEGIGRVGFIDSFTYYFVTIAEFGIMVYGIREIAKEKSNPERLSKLVSELMTLHIISSLCTLVLYATGVFILWNKIGDTRLLLFSVSFLVVNFFTCDWYFMGRERFGYITLRSVIIRLLGLASIFLLVKQSPDYYIYYGIIAGSAIAGIIWNNLILFREVKFSFRKVNWKKHLRYVWVTYLISLLYTVPLVLDNVLLRLVSTAAAVGLYAFSVKMVRVGVNLLTDSFLVFFPRIVSLAKENDDQQLKQKLSLNIQFIILLAIPMGAGLYLVADELTIVFFGSKFLPVADNLRLLAIFPFLKGISLFLSNPVLIAHHREKNFLRNLFGGTFLFVTAALILGARYSDRGVCAALVLTELFMMVTNYISAKRELPLLQLIDWKTIGQALLGSALFIPLVYTAKTSFDTHLMRLVVSITGCLLIYGVFLLLIRNSFAMQIRNIVGGFIFKKSS